MSIGVVGIVSQLYRLIANVKNCCNTDEFHTKQQTEEEPGSGRDDNGGRQDGERATDAAGRTSTMTTALTRTTTTTVSLPDDSALTRTTTTTVSLPDDSALTRTTTTTVSLPDDSALTRTTTTTVSLLDDSALTRTTTTTVSLPDDSAVTASPAVSHREPPIIVLQEAPVGPRQHGGGLLDAAAAAVWIERQRTLHDLSRSAAGPTAGARADSRSAAPMSRRERLNRRRQRSATASAAAARPLDPLTGVLLCPEALEHIVVHSSIIPDPAAEPGPSGAGGLPQTSK